MDINELLFAVRGCEATFSLEDVAAVAGLHPSSVGVWLLEHGAENFDLVCARKLILIRWHELATVEGMSLDDAANRLKALYRDKLVDLPEWVYGVVEGFGLQTLYRWKRLHLSGDRALGNPCGTPRKGKSGIDENPEYKSFVAAGIEQGFSGRKIAREGAQTFSDFPSEATVRRYLKRREKGN